MQYEVRYQIGGEEQSDLVEAETAADAARIVQDQYLASSDIFELIQVHLLENETNPDAVESGNNVDQ